MPLAVTHVILTILAVDIYRDYFAKHKRYLSLHTILIAGVAGLLPDIDIPISWAYQFFTGSEKWLHGYWTHTPFFALLFLIPGLYLYFLKDDKKKGVLLYVISFGIFFHLFLDWFLGGGAGEGVMWFWPISTYASKLHLLLKLDISGLFMGLDAALLIVWLWHEEMKHKIKDYI